MTGGARKKEQEAEEEEKKEIKNPKLCVPLTGFQPSQGIPVHGSKPVVVPDHGGFSVPTVGAAFLSVGYMLLCLIAPLPLHGRRLPTALSRCVRRHRRGDTITLLTGVPWKR
jgi:hypothetical protein